MNVLDLFSGIGGFSLGLERAGFQTSAFCEIDPFCRQVLARHWPGVPIHDDIRQLDGTQYAGTVDLVCGGYPCQPFSCAGKRLGESDPRHLWPEMHRIIREIRPRWVVAENVRGHVRLGLDAVVTQLEGDGYTCWPALVPASAVGRKQNRERVWILAHAADRGNQPSSTQLDVRGFQEAVLRAGWYTHDWSAEPGIRRVADGIPARIHRLRALGNAVVPQIPELIGRTILAYEQHYGLAA